MGGATAVSLKNNAVTLTIAVRARYGESRISLTNNVACRFSTICEHNTQRKTVTASAQYLFATLLTQ